MQRVGRAGPFCCVNATLAADLRCRVASLKDTSVQKKYQVATAAAVVLSLLAVIHLLHNKIDGLLAGDARASNPVVPRAAVVKFFSLGYEQLLADCWWLAFIQYFGDNRQRKVDHYRYAYEYLDLITQLDPRFIQAYWFAAFAVGAEQKRPDLAAKLIERGLQHNQDDWYLPFIAGVNQYLFAHNSTLAAKYYRMAAKFPQAPDWLERQAVLLQANVPILFKKIATWEIIYVSTKDALVKESARQKLIPLLTYVYQNAPLESARKVAANKLRLLGVELNG
jgi:hypothetical protein